MTQENRMAAPDWPQIAQWRKAERARLVAQRLAIPAATRAAHGDAIAAGLDGLVTRPGGIVAAYWPFRGEPDLRPWLARLDARGLGTALPVVVAKGAPMVFRLWRAGDPLARGVWDIPVPADGAEVIPDFVIAPLVGFDAANYRLGYGGGYFDRTLATLPAATVAIGVGYAGTALETIHPQPFDIPMRHIVTEAGRDAPHAGHQAG